MTITPDIFFSRSKILYLIISSVQLVHLIFVSEFAVFNVIIWLLLFMVGLLFFLSVEYIPDYRSWPFINRRIFSIAFFLSFVVTLFYSRLPYLDSYLSEGMYATRQNSELGSGGLYSFLTVFFYPLSLMLAIVELKRKYLFYIALLIILMIDIVVLGTRGVPFFVIIFHALFLKRRYSFHFLAPVLLVGVILLVAVFEYQTESRSVTDYYNWRNTVEHSRVFDKSPVKDFYLKGEFPGSFYVGVYISQYITHSIPEFRELLTENSYGAVGSFDYFMDEVCLVAMCDRSGYQENIAEMNDRVGLYQTLYSSLLLDFGYVGILILALVILFIILFSSRVSLIFLVYLSMVFSFSMIDNYIYNAMGLGRFFLFVGVFYLLSIRYDFTSRPALV